MRVRHESDAKKRSTGFVFRDRTNPVVSIYTGNRDFFRVLPDERNWQMMLAARDV